MYVYVYVCIVHIIDKEFISILSDKNPLYSVSRNFSQLGTKGQSQGRTQGGGVVLVAPLSPGGMGKYGENPISDNL